MSQIWTSVKERLREEMEKQSYKTWIENTLAAINEDDLIIYCDNEFQRDWLEKQYIDLIFHTVKVITGQTYEIYFEVKSKDSLIGSVDDMDTLRKKVTDLEKSMKALEERLRRLEGTGSSTH
ncbi:DnaA N-terminal domain-containing protein [Sutcliffiella horikoshii]|uniref:DnaA N-terminal domain-containing protein n=1 Tax=Sutcliffiella horikoshii TaxID=79883 RepID=A0AA94WME5_9BACI|nr:DnaA N-terminal domain-containing protein [Sutcliffiella horikoshii]TYS58559.1 hypothetical protein FZC74_12195 [Sutcliffiella horikoshii]